MSDGSDPGAEAYDELVRSYPGIFSGRELRPIILDRERRRAFTEHTGQPLGVIAANPYFYVVSDLVERRDSGDEPFAYVRIVQRAQLLGAPGVAVLATIDDSRLGPLGAVVIIDQERHATGRVEMEIPRGFGVPGESAEASAARELREETGYIGGLPHKLGQVVPDSGIQDGCVTLFHVAVRDRIAVARERFEAIRDVRLVAPEDFVAAIRTGACRDSFTIAAAAIMYGFSSPPSKE